MDKEALKNSILAIKSPQINDIKKILDSILMEVFGTGLDYLYIINDI